MTRQQLLLIMLMEECDEVSQRASKALRFGLKEIQEGQDLDNAERICLEFNDLFTIVDMLSAEKSLPEDKLLDIFQLDAKKAKVEKWLKHSQDQGVLKNEVPNV
jgi:hypothetical protein